MLEHISDSSADELASRRAAALRADFGALGATFGVGLNGGVLGDTSSAALEGLPKPTSDIRVKRSRPPWY